MKQNRSQQHVIVIAFLLSSFIISIFAPKSFEEESSQTQLTKHENIFLEGTLSDLNPANGFVSHAIIFERSNISQPLHTSIEYSSKLDLIDSKKSTITKEFKGKIYPITPNRQSKSTGSFRLYYDQVLSYSKISIQVKIQSLPGNIKSIILVNKMGNPKYNLFVLLIRILFIILSLFRALKIVKKKLKESHHMVYFWLFFLSSNPLMIAHHYFPSKLFIVIDNLFQALFDSYFRYYLIYILSTFRNSTNSQLPIFFFFTVHLLTKICHNMSPDLKNIDFTTAVSTQSLPFLTFELGLCMTYFTWLIVAVSSSYSKAKTNFEKSVMKPLYVFFGMFAGIYFASMLLNNYVLAFNNQINMEFLNFALYYSSAYLIGVLGSSNFSDLKILKFINDDEKAEPLSIVFE